MKAFVHGTLTKHKIRGTNGFRVWIKPTDGGTFYGPKYTIKKDS